jgi:hypothetical protein
MPRGGDDDDDDDNNAELQVGPLKTAEEGKEVSKDSSTKAIEEAKAEVI